MVSYVGRRGHTTTTDLRSGPGAAPPPAETPLTPSPEPGPKAPRHHMKSVPFDDIVDLEAQGHYKQWGPAGSPYDDPPIFRRRLIQQGSYSDSFIMEIITTPQAIRIPVYKSIQDRPLLRDVVFDLLTTTFQTANGFAGNIANAISVAYQGSTESHRYWLFDAEDFLQLQKLAPKTKYNAIVLRIEEDGDGGFICTLSGIGKKDGLIRSLGTVPVGIPENWPNLAQIVLDQNTAGAPTHQHIGLDATFIGDTITWLKGLHPIRTQATALSSAYYVWALEGDTDPPPGTVLDHTTELDYPPVRHLSIIMPMVKGGA